MLGLTVLLLLISSISTEFNLQQNDYKVEMEHSEVVHRNSDLMREAKVVTFKYNRTTMAFNASITTNVNVGNDVHVIIQAYRFASNEYRYFPIRFQAQLCKLMAANVLGAQQIVQCGNFPDCYFRKGIKKTFCNWVPNTSMLPPRIPSGRYKLDLLYLVNTTEAFTVSGYARVYRDIV